MVRLESPMHADNPYAPPRETSAPGSPRDLPSAPAGEMVVDVDINADDLVAFGVFHVQRSSWRLRSLLKSRLWAAAYGGLLAFALFPPDSSDALLAFGVSLLVLMPVFFFGYPVLLRLLMTRNTRRSLRLGRNLASIGSRRVRLTAQALEIEGPYTSIRTRWPAIERIELSSELIIFYTSANSGELVPIRCFASNEQFLHFVDLARQHHERAA